jgi:RNA polymerase sigma-70 factor (ECF subfamily)
VSLAQQLLDSLPDRERSDDPTIDELLAAGVADARRRWPGVAVEPAAYVAWIAQRLPADAVSVVAGLRSLHLGDLALACACAAGDGKALAAFDAAFLTRGGVSDDVKQALRAKLFVAEAGGAPRIARYGGRGELRRWVRAAAVRMSVDDIRGVREFATENDTLLAAIGIDASRNPAVEYSKMEAVAILQGAVHEAIGVLSDRHRVLLLHYYIDGLDLAELAKLFAIAPSNVSRSLAKARVALLSGIRRSLMKNNKIPPDELDSLVALVKSRLSMVGGLRAR